jgi:hypothetical protein
MQAVELSHECSLHWILGQRIFRKKYKRTCYSRSKLRVPRHHILGLYVYFHKKKTKEPDEFRAVLLTKDAPKSWDLTVKNQYDRFYWKMVIYGGFLELNKQLISIKRRNWFNRRTY